jgi:hypothetical protein
VEPTATLNQTVTSILQRNTFGEHREQKTLIAMKLATGEITTEPLKYLT